MKFSTLLLLFISLFSVDVIACSFIPDSFCKTNNTFPDNIIASGKIVHVDEDGINLEIIQILRGDVSTDTIRIWDGTDFDCNGPWSLAASQLGALGDSILINIPLIDTIQNTWDVIGDYRMPEPYSATHQLRIDNDTVRGFITGYPAPGYYLRELSYNDFLADWETSMSDCSLWVDTDNVESQKPVISYTNPINDICTIKFSGELDFQKQIEVYFFDGKKVKTTNSHYDTVELDFSSFASGIYFVRIVGREGKASVIKVVKI